MVLIDLAIALRRAWALRRLRAAGAQSTAAALHVAVCTESLLATRNHLGFCYRVLCRVLSRVCYVMQVGGRCNTRDVPGLGRVEFGATYFHGTDGHPLWDLAKEHGLPGLQPEPKGALLGP